MDKIYKIGDSVTIIKEGSFSGYYDLAVNIFELDNWVKGDDPYPNQEYKIIGKSFHGEKVNKIIYAIESKIDGSQYMVSGNSITSNKRILTKKEIEDGFILTVQDY